ncbi:LutC/YkgG family protein [Terrihalobacillus insolitus]|uniref:LutC/YkgG family protein n=1 Tax=Terrihalobacillus insolitus TaxID=2950438 RepID=UPI00234193DB|nr:lactate utilization protein C [Terrihalobacillus insolitus]MDC3414837.1 lactate utilization protein C [Terrihalobacillus insolitus]
MTNGTIQNRDSFLKNIASQLNRERRHSGVERPNWQHQAQWRVLANLNQDELVEVLKEQCKVIHTDFVQTDQANLNRNLLTAIQRYHGKSVIRSDDVRFDEFGLTEAFSQFETEHHMNVHTWHAENREESVSIAEQADVGITFCDRTLAESGTVVLFNDEGKGRSVSLLPATYIAIIPKSTIVPRMSQVTREIHHRSEKGERIASCINFITGPSNSADIEMNLVVGVHGPIKVTYIVVEDK